MAAGQIKAPIIIPLKPPLIKSKNLTTEIKFDLVSETMNTDIYFTVNGSKPEPFKLIGDKNTFRFTVPFSLPSGKRIVKAIAVSKDGSRESNIVTKVYDIEQVDSVDTHKKIQQDVYGFLEDLKDKKNGIDFAHYESKKCGSEKQRINELNNSSNLTNCNLRSIVPQYLSTRSSTNRKFNKMSDYLSGLNLESDNLVKVHKTKDETDKDQSIRTISDTGYQSLRLQRETDFLKCVYCLAARPTDPLAKFCNNCGQAISQLPISRLPPPENGQLGICVHCRSTVPMNILNCLVCEAALNIQNQPQVTNKLKERILCAVCGTANPPNLDSCLTCEARLQENGKTFKMFQSDQSANGNAFTNVSIINCKKCARKNNIDSRFCDWCGHKCNSELNTLLTNIGHTICSKCGANNQNNAIYCCQCGNTIPPPMTHFMSLKNGNGDSEWNSITLPIPNNNGILKPENIISKNSIFVNRNLFCDVSTQTVGLFYPSTAQLNKNENIKSGFKNNISDKSNILSLVSPGKGFWRKQLDHIIFHLKAYASNSPEFQAMIGEPRMGKLINADVHDEDIELQLNLTFALKGYIDPYKREISDEFDKRYLSSILKRTGSFDSFKSDDTLMSNGNLKPKRTPTTSSRCRSSKKVLATKKSSRSTTEQILSNIDQKLLKEISKIGQGRSSEIERLFEEGANPKAKNGKGVPFIIVAVRNMHKDSIRTLHRLGADVNDIEPQSGNTPLHEAVLLDSMCADIINELLDCGANNKIKNYKNDNPNDLALKLNNDIAIKLFSSKIGKNQIEKLIQPRQNNTDDEKI